MIKKTLPVVVSTALSVLISTASYAATTATAHKTWGVPEIKFTINQKKAKADTYNPFLAKAKRKQAASNYLAASTKITNTDISNEDGTTVTAEAEVTQFLGNFGFNPQSYTVTHTVCTLKNDGEIYTNERCTNSSTDYIVAPDDATFSTNNATLRWDGVEPGDYLIVFSTSIQNLEGDTIFHSYDVKQLNIAAAK